MDRSIFVINQFLRLNNRYLIIYSSFVFTRGSKRTFVFNEVRGISFFVPNSFYDLFLGKNSFDLYSLKRLSSREQVDLIFGYLEFIKKNQIGYFSKYNKPLNSSESWDEPSKIINAIIEISPVTLNSMSNILESVKELGCRHLELHFAPKYKLSKFHMKNLILSLKEFCSVIIYLPYDVYVMQNELLVLFNELKSKVNVKINVYNSPEIAVRNNISFVSQLDLRKSCGNIANQFSLNTVTYTESMSLNSCLNRKVSIDREGNIKNCPSLPIVYGNILEKSIKDTINNNKFKKIWKVKKDEIKVCQSCEFRYVCTDCRAYLEDPKDLYSKPLKCGYDPYTGIWSEWSANPLKQRAIEYYGIKTESKL